MYSYSDQGMSAEVSLATTNTNPSTDTTNTTVTRANTTVYGYSPEGLWGTDPLFIKPVGASSQVVYPITDHLGTPQMLVNQAGATVWEGQYSAFGIQLNQASDNNYSNSAQTLRFPGQYADSETQLYYNWNRYYDPETGRYITSDPIGLGGGVHIYRYGSNNPNSFLDPNGLREQDVAALINLIEREIPGIDVGDNWDFGNPGRGNDAATTVFRGKMIFREKYSKDLCFEDFQQLFDDVLHESMHASDSFYTRLNDVLTPGHTKNHDGINNRVAWESDQPVLKPGEPKPGQTSTDLTYSNDNIWRKNSEVSQKGSARNPDPLINQLPDLYDKLYPNGVPGCPCR